MQVKEQITNTSETLRRVQMIEIYRFRALNTLKKTKKTPKPKKFWEIKTKNIYTRLTEYKKLAY